VASGVGETAGGEGDTGATAAAAELGEAAVGTGIAAGATGTGAMAEFADTTGAAGGCAGGATLGGVTVALAGGVSAGEEFFAGAPVAVGAEEGVAAFAGGAGFEAGAGAVVCVIADRSTVADFVSAGVLVLATFSPPGAGAEPEGRSSKATPPTTSTARSSPSTTSVRVPIARPRLAITGASGGAGVSESPPARACSAFFSASLMRLMARLRSRGEIGEIAKRAAHVPKGDLG
jgi:hypothetical protein